MQFGDWSSDVCSSDLTQAYGFNPEGPEFQIDRDSDATWILSGEKIEKLFQMTNFDHEIGRASCRERV